MPPRPISPRLHGIIDYATGVELLMLPKLLGITGSRSSRVLRFAGLSHLAYSVMTNYELGIVKRLPFKTHLAIDAAAAGGLVAAPWLLGTKSEGTRHWLPQVIVGLNEAAVTALTQPQEPGTEGVETRTVSDATGDVELSTPDPKSAVMPDGAEANEGIGARTIGDV